MLNKDEARRGGDLARAPGVCLVADTPEYSANILTIKRLQRRFGLAPELAAVVAQLAGLGLRRGMR